MSEMNLFEQFRQAVYGCLRKRVDALLKRLARSDVKKRAGGPRPAKP